MADSDFSFGGVSVPDGTKRLYVTATLVPSTGDPRIQPTGFPDIGPVLYPDPSGEHGQICLIESEASMANRLEEVAVADKYTGALAPELASLPYIRVEKGERFMTASTIDGHRFASEYVMKAKLREANGDAQKGEKLVDYVKRELDGSADNIPAANVPRIFRLAMELDPLALIHGFQISLKGELTFVGLRSPRALTACIVGLNAQPVGVPGVRIDPIGTGDAGQAIFRKERIVAKVIQANFAIDIGLLTGLPVGAEPAQDEKNDAANETRDHRRRLLVALALWKVANFLKELSDGHRLRSECDLALESVTYRTKWKGATDASFPFASALSRIDPGLLSKSGPLGRGGERSMCACSGSARAVSAVAGSYRTYMSGLANGLARRRAARRRGERGRKPRGAGTILTTSPPTVFSAAV